MTDTAELCRRANQTGWEKGTVDSCNAIIAWLNRTGQGMVATHLLACWEAGEVTMVIAEPVAPAPTPAPVSPTDLGPVAPKMVNRATASQMGFTGNCCSTCGSYQMVRNGTCEKCNECGSTTGCS